MIEVKINDNLEVTIHTTKGSHETEVATNLVNEVLKTLCEKKTNDIYALKMTSFDPYKKLTAVKEVKETLNLGLKESKDLVDECNNIHEVFLARGSYEKMMELHSKFEGSHIVTHVVEI